MKSFVLLASCLTLVSALFGKKSGSNPLALVTELLTKLKDQIVADGVKDEQVFVELQKWCASDKQEQEHSITDAQVEIDRTTALIESSQDDAEQTTTAISELASSIAQSEAELKAQTNMRDEEHKTYADDEAELVEVVATLNRAISILNRHLLNAQGAVLVQANSKGDDVSMLVAVLDTLVDAASLSLHDKRQLTAFAQKAAANDDAFDDFNAPSVAAYASHSKSIIDVLEDLLSKANKNLQTVRTEEMTRRHEFELSAQTLSAEMANDQKVLEAKKQRVAEAHAVIVTQKGLLAAAQENLAKAQDAFAQNKMSCETAVQDHEESKKNREEELQAITKALTILSETTDAMSFVQVHQHQVRAQSSSKLEGMGIRVADMIRDLASKNKEKQTLLSQLASRIDMAAQASDDPFVKVRGLIEDMIQRLKKEGEAEVTQKAWCDKEYGQTKEKVESLGTRIETLDARIKRGDADIARLTGQVEAHRATVADIVASRIEAQKIRTEEHEDYIKTTTDLKTGLEGLRQAEAVLREYYAAHPPAETTESSSALPVHSSSASGADIISILTMIATDMNKALTSAEVEERTSAAEFQKNDMTAQINKGSNEKDAEYKQLEIAKTKAKMKEHQADLDYDQKELAAVDDYDAQIKAACEVQPLSFEERGQRRADLIAGLKEALKILSEDAAALLQKKPVSGQMAKKLNLRSSRPRLSH